MKGYKRIPEDEPLVDAIASTEQADATWVQGSGRVRSVELKAPNGETVKVAASAHLLSVAGPATGPLMAVVATDDGSRLVGGELSAAVSEGAFITYSTPDAPEPKFKKPAEKKPEAPSSWAEIAAQAAAEIDDGEPEQFEMPRQKDRVDHFAFGLCDVMIVRGDRMKIRDARGPGRIREIDLKLLEVLPPKEIRGKKVYKLVKRQG